MSSTLAHCCHVCGSDFRRDCKICCISDFVWFKDNDFSSRSLAPCDCKDHGKVCNKNINNSFSPKHQQLVCNQQMSTATLPEMLDFRLDEKGTGSRTVVARLDLQARSLFGPFMAPLIPSIQQTASRYPFAIVNPPEKREVRRLDLLTDSDDDCNWMKHVRFSGNRDSNLIAFQFADSIYFVVAERVCIGEELVVSHSQSYSHLLHSSKVSSYRKFAQLYRNTPGTNEIDSAKWDSTTKRLFSNPIKQPVNGPAASVRPTTNFGKQSENAVIRLILPKLASNQPPKLLAINGCQESQKQPVIYRLDPLGPSPKTLPTTLDCNSTSTLTSIAPIQFFPENDGVSAMPNVEAEQSSGSPGMPVDPDYFENEIVGFDGENDSPESAMDCSPKSQVREELPNHHLSTAVILKSLQRKHHITIKPSPSKTYKRKYICRYCSRDLKYSEVREHYHMHSVDGRYPCPKGCALQLETVYKLHDHCERKHETKACEVCGQKFSKYELPKHVETHKEGGYPCNQCGEILTAKRGLQEHIRRMHEDPVRRRAAHQGPLRRNVQRDKWDTHFLKCNECQMGFRNKKAFVDHLDTRHPDIQKSSIPELNLPMKTVTTYLCRIRTCGRIFCSMSEAEEHVKKHAEAHVLAAQERKRKRPSQDDVVLGGAVLKTDRELNYCHYCDRSFQGPRHFLHHCKSAHPEYHDVLMPHAPKDINWLILHSKARKRSSPDEDESS